MRPNVLPRVSRQRCALPVHPNDRHAKGPTDKIPFALWVHCYCGSAACPFAISNGVYVFHAPFCGRTLVQPNLDILEFYSRHHLPNGPAANAMADAILKFDQA
jgi:hypothetical protein